MNKKHCNYEICIVSSTTTSIDDIVGVVKSLETLSIDVSYYCEVGRFDACYKIKDNDRITVFQIDLALLSNEAIQVTRKILDNSDYVLRYCLFNKKNLSIRFDYKDPKALGKYLFENYSIWPRELTLLSAKDQRKLAKAVKASKTLALIGYKEY